MTDESYTSMLLAAICVLAFACGMLALVQHPEWFGS
jgi:hypothetical protein